MPYNLLHTKLYIPPHRPSFILRKRLTARLDNALREKQGLTQTLFITLGTAKWHIHNIYSKMGVNSRTQAIARARELRII